MKRQYRSFDVLLLLAVLAVCIFGVILIGSSIKENDSVPNIDKVQIFWIVMGMGLLFAAAFINYQFITKFYLIIYGVNIVLLLLVLAVGSKDQNASRWLGIGSFGIQPSEFAKIFMIIFLSKYLSKKTENEKSINKPQVLSIAALTIIFPAVLVFIQPSLSASIVILFIGIMLLYTAGLSHLLILAVLAVVIPLGTFLYSDINSDNPLLIDKLFPYQVTRLKTYLNPDAEENKDATYQTDRSIQVISSGQLHGKGLYNGLSSTRAYVPYAYNDFIFSVVGEEFGFVGCAVLLGALLFIITRCLLIAAKACDTCGKLIATGTAVMIAFQTFVNVGVATGILPNTGISLPFVSYGGSSMLISMTAIGLTINVGITKTKAYFE